MSSFFGKLRGNNSSGGTSSERATKRDSLALHPTPLTKLLQSAGPLRDDGSDKFFGLENFGNTCYCNSILQCLYYSVPFREEVMQYPVRSSPEMLRSKVSTIPTRLNVNNGTIGPATVTLLPRLVGPGSPGIRPEDKPDTPEYKKKHAMLAGPVVMMDYEHAKSYGMSESLFTSLKDLFEAIVAHPSRHGVVAPHRFLENLKIKDEMFRTSMHQDAHEFLNLLLNDVVTNVAENTRKTKESHLNGLTPTIPPSLGHVLSTANGEPNGALISASPPRSWVHELFEGTLTSETKCLTCENVSQRDEAFLDLSVDLEEHSSVTRCIKKFSEEEMLCERNKFHCDNCGGLQEAEKRMKIKRLPRILALHLKRFKYIEDQQRFQKLFHRVRYPYHLRMSNTTDDAADPDRLYELYAVVVHIGGGPYHGHYVAIVKTEDRGWLLFDDELVEPVEKSYVQNFFGDKPGLACAYVLFYQATTEEAVRREQEAEGQAPTLTPLGTKDIPTHISTNGHGRGKLMDGGLHCLTTDTNAALLAKEESPNLTHVIPNPSPVHPALPMSDTPFTHSHTVSHPLSPRADARSKKERAETERRQRRAEKDADRVEKARYKSTELRHREEEKQRQAEVKASTVSVAPIVTRIPPPPAPPQVVQASDRPGVSSAEHSPASQRLSAVDDNPTAPPLSGGGLGGSLSRLRRSSKSLSRKSIFGSNSNSSGTNHTRNHYDEFPSPTPHRNTDVFGGGSGDSGPSTPEKRRSAANGGSSIPSSDGKATKQYLPPSQHAHQQPTNKPLPPNPPVESQHGIPDKSERSRGVSLGHRFSLRKKTSGLFGLGS